MSMKDLLSKMSELQGTVESEPVMSNGKAVLNESSKTVKESAKTTLKGIFNSLLSEAEQVTIQPAQQKTQVIKQGQKTIGTVENPQLAQQIKQSIGKGEMTLAGDDELNEIDDKSNSYEDSFRSETDKMLPGTKAYVGRKNNMEVFAIKNGKGNIKFYHRKGIKGPLRRVEESKLTEKAVSKSQQQAAGAALAAKRGDAPKSKLKSASKEMAKMPTKELEKFASTKHKGLPDKKEKTDEAAMPTHDGDFGAGLGAGRNNKTLESKKPKPDFLDLDKDGNKKESMKKAAADKQKVSTMKKTNEAKAKPDFLDLDKDGDKKESMKKAVADKKKTGSADKDSSAGLTAAQKKLPAGLQKAVAKKKTVKEGTNPTEAARLLGKAHAMGKDPFACKYEEGSPEAHAYLDGYKEGLDECYGSGGMAMQQDIGMMPGMDSMVSMSDTSSPRSGSEFEVDSMDNIGSFGGFDNQPTQSDMMAFEAWDRELNALLNEGKMKDIDIDMKEMSDAQFKKEHGKSKADMKKDLSGDAKKPVKEGISVSVSKGQQGSPDSVSVTAQDGDADALLAMIKQAGLGLFGGEEQSGYGAPITPQMPTSDVGDHDSMMDLIKKMSSTGNDYEDEESQDDEHVHGHPDAACDVCGSSECDCDSESDSKALVVGEDETEDQMEFEIAEANAPDSDEAETSADENAEAKEDQALAGADSDDEEEIDESNCSEDETEEELTEWANDAGYTGSENTKDNTFEQDIEFMMNVISGGLNNQKKDQTTLPHTRVKVDESRQAINDWKKLSGIK